MQHPVFLWSKADGFFELLIESDGIVGFGRSGYFVFTILGAN